MATVKFNGQTLTYNEASVYDNGVGTCVVAFDESYDEYFIEWDADGEIDTVTPMLEERT